VQDDDLLQLSCQLVLFFIYYAGLLLKVDVPEATGHLFGHLQVAVSVLPMALGLLLILRASLWPMVQLFLEIHRAQRKLKALGLFGSGRNAIDWRQADQTGDVPDQLSQALGASAKVGRY
jgi:hypothetical protein